MGFLFFVIGAMLLVGLERHYLDGWSIRDSDWEQLMLAAVLCLMRIAWLLARIERSIHKGEPAQSDREDVARR